MASKSSSDSCSSQTQFLVALEILCFPEACLEDRVDTSTHPSNCGERRNRPPGTKRIPTWSPWIVNYTLRNDTIDCQGPPPKYGWRDDHFGAGKCSVPLHCGSIPLSRPLVPTIVNPPRVVSENEWKNHRIQYEQFDLRP